jgi:hypothetical protein
VGVFFRYALGRGRADFIRDAVNISTATDGGVSYETVLSMNVWDISLVNDQIDRINKAAKRGMK